MNKYEREKKRERAIDKQKGGYKNSNCNFRKKGNEQQQSTHL